MGPIFLVIIFLNATGAPIPNEIAQYPYTKLTDCQAVATMLNTIKNGTTNAYRSVCIDTTAH